MAAAAGDPPHAWKLPVKVAPGGGERVAAAGDGHSVAVLPATRLITELEGGTDVGGDDPRRVSVWA